MFLAGRDLNGGLFFVDPPAEHRPSRTMPKPGIRADGIELWMVYGEGLPALHVVNTLSDKLEGNLRNEAGK